MARDKASGGYETIPVFTPSLAEMKDFSGLLQALYEKGAADFGVCKIVPPKSWKWSVDMAEARSLIIDTPIRQVVCGRAGVFTVTNLEQDAMSVWEFETMAEAKQPKDIDELIEQQNWSELERKFWKSITMTSEPPVYGADTVATLFGDAKVPFNVNHLDCMLKKCGVDLPGVSKPMIYAGMNRAFFCIPHGGLKHVFDKLCALRQTKDVVWSAFHLRQSCRVICQKLVAGRDMPGAHASQD